MRGRESLLSCGPGCQKEGLGGMKRYEPLRVVAARFGLWRRGGFCLGSLGVVSM